MNWLRSWWRSSLESWDRDAEREAKEEQDRLCAALRACGADARLAPKGRPEETLGIKEIWGYEHNRSSYGLFDIDGSPIRWVNFLDAGLLEDSLRIKIIHGIPDSRNLPQVTIWIMPYKHWLYFGENVVQWSGNDHDTGIKQLLNNDIIIREAFMTANKGRYIDQTFMLGIRYLCEQHCWLIVLEENYGLAPLEIEKEKWKCCELIAEQLLAAPVQE